MNKNLLKSLLCLFAIAAVAPDYAAHGQEKNGLTRSIIIYNGDTAVNGKKFSELSNDERTKLRREIKEMERNFKGGSSIRTRGDEVVIRKEGGGNKDVVITRKVKEPNALVWNNDIGAELRSYNFKGNKPGDLRVIKPNGDRMLLDKEFQVFSFGGDSSMNFKFNADSLINSFENFGLDSNLRKRVITMNRERATGMPGAMVFRGDGPAMGFEKRLFPSVMERNNSSSFNYNHTDKDGISSHMNIRIGDASKEQLKNITGNETITKSLDVSDLTLFPNFSNGKITLSFSLASKDSAKIKIYDSDMKSIFTDELSGFSGNYVKQLTLPKNGVYYVAVSQNGNWYVKRLVKE
ncbi:T9SS type A sorting domain-containing protein [Daejeonella sp.]|uniref:T9SS type A sorting domain-containing protein n=1 Tax=Daejeonella sp. TaxID=2805397 RepID=UPI0039837CF5